MKYKEIQAVRKVWKALEKEKSVILVYGGAGASKSYSTAQYFIYKLLAEPNMHLLITRKTNPSLKLSNWQLVLSLLKELEIPHEVKYAEQIITLPNRSAFIFRGLDDREKIKSSELNYAWMEEATEFEYEDYLQVKLRLRRTRSVAGKNKLVLTFNPIPSWIKDVLIDEKRESDIEICQVTYRDNPFLSQEYVKQLLELANQDKMYYQIYAEGQFAIPEHIIYDNWQVLDDAEFPQEFDEVIYGLDFGYNNPTALIEVGLKDDNVYVIRELYEKYLTNADLIERMKSFVRFKNAVIYGDSAEPQRIEELRRAGFNVVGADKSVRDGIDSLKRRKIYISKWCVETIKEIKLYSWKVDYRGVVLDEPVKVNDHSMDALRYAVYTHTRSNKARPKVRII